MGRGEYLYTLADRVEEQGVPRYVPHSAVLKVRSRGPSGATPSIAVGAVIDWEASEWVDKDERLVTPCGATPNLWFWMYNPVERGGLPIHARGKLECGSDPALVMAAGCGYDGCLIPGWDDCWHEEGCLGNTGNWNYRIIAGAGNGMQQQGGWTLLLSGQRLQLYYR